VTLARRYDGQGVRRGLRAPSVGGEYLFLLNGQTQVVDSTQVVSPDTRATFDGADAFETAGFRLNVALSSQTNRNFLVAGSTVVLQYNAGGGQAVRIITPADTTSLGTVPYQQDRVIEIVVNFVVGRGWVYDVATGDLITTDVFAGDYASYVASDFTFGAAGTTVTAPRPL